MLHALLQVVCTEMCIGSVCKQPPYNDKMIQMITFIISLNVSLCVTPHGRRPLPRLLIDSSVLTQTALVSYLRPALSELS